MTARERWAAVNELFHRALEHPREERSAFLERECARDPALLAEVSSLVEAHDSAGSFLDLPGLDGPGHPPADVLVGRAVAHYRVERILGEGGMGVVYLAQDTRLNRPVALKALPPRFTRDEASRQRLRREARAAAALAHPGIAIVYALEEIDEDVFIAFEYVPGETLREAIGRGPLPPQEVGRMGAAIARALATAHAAGIVHRDLKPENVVRTPAGDVKILDFGVARFREPLGSTLTLAGPGTLLGTPAHMSPEQLRGDPVDERTDLFSLGVLLYELASGVSPFRGADYASTIARILEARPRRLSEVAPAGADRSSLRALEAVVVRLLEPMPDARFQSAADVIQALEVPDAPPITTDVATSGHALWWWKFHQAATSATYAALLVPLWKVHEWMPGLPARLLFMAGLAAAVVAIVLRLHLWFTVRSYPGEWRTQQRTAGRWIAAGDIGYSAVLAVAAAVIVSEHGRTAAFLLGAAVAVVVSFAVIEPATTRAAFDGRGET
jgi:serine/threonine protein kinase